MTPNTRIATVAPRPIAREIRPASATRVIMSRPKASVPNGCSRLGPCRDIDRSCSFGSYGEMIGQNTQKATISRKMVPATTAPLFWT